MADIKVDLGGHKYVFIVRAPGAGSGGWDVLRVGKVDQGWHIGTYTEKRDAVDVAAFLNSKRGCMA